MLSDTKSTILIVDDSPENIDIVMAILRDFDLITVTSGKEALSIVEQDHVDLILLDIMMPQMDGFEVCTRFKNDPKASHIPIIFLTARNDEDTIEKSFAVGGFDYVTKPIRPRELIARVKFHLGYQEMFKQLEYVASHDTLTGIYNRGKFFELGKKFFLSKATHVFAMICDIDHFKQINDKYGHHTGDSVLKEVTTTISKCLLEQSLFGRIGGEEFAILLTAESAEEAMALAETVRQAVAQLRDTTSTRACSCTLSTGISQKSKATPTLDRLLMSADIALYEAKDSGRNRSIFRG